MITKNKFSETQFCFQTFDSHNTYNISNASSHFNPSSFPSTESAEKADADGFFVILIYSINKVKKDISWLNNICDFHTDFFNVFGCGVVGMPLS